MEVVGTIAAVAVGTPVGCTPCRLYYNSLKVPLAKKCIANTRNGGDSKPVHQGTARHCSKHERCDICIAVGIWEIYSIETAQVQGGCSVCDARQRQRVELEDTWAHADRLERSRHMQQCMSSSKTKR